MLIFYIRSSSQGTWELCQFQYFLKYLLNLDDKTNFKAEFGNMVHKGLELLSHRKLCEQNGIKVYFDEESGKTFDVDKITIESAAEFGFQHYLKINKSNTNWSPDTLNNVLEQVKNVTDCSGGIFNPLNRTIVSPEKYFDITINEDWAYYDYPNGNERVKGFLSIKGTMDLVTEVGPNSLEYIDYKTGRRWSWSGDYVKDYDELQNDPQLLLYFYALATLYPKYKYIHMTIFYTKDGGPFTIQFDRTKDVPRALEMIKKNFLDIKNCIKPNRIWDNDEARNNKCLKFCHFGRTKHESGVRLCSFYNKELQQLGMDKMFKKYSNMKKLGKYSEGGGKQNKEGKE